MKKTNISICDNCRRIIANKKCSFCEKDICDDCSNEVEIGTVMFNFCKNCMNKLERSGYDRPSFWENFNKNEDMKEKIIQYLKKSLIIKNLSDDEEEDEEEYEPSTHRRLAKRNIRIGKLRTGSWAKAMRGDSL